MNCCGAVGPHDYLYSSWFNHSKDTSGAFVPPSCCLVQKATSSIFSPLRTRLANENYCQVEAILYPKNQNDTYEYLKTQVGMTLVAGIFSTPTPPPTGVKGLPSLSECPPEACTPVEPPTGVHREGA